MKNKTADTNGSAEQQKRSKIPAVEEFRKDEVDLNSVESFPASDPPSWTLGCDSKERHDKEKRIS